MKTKAKLAFEMLEKEMELIRKEEQAGFKGGGDGKGWEYGIDPQGNTYYRQQGDDTWTAFKPLGVEVTPDGPPKPNQDMIDTSTIYHEPSLDSDRPWYGIHNPNAPTPSGVVGGDDQSYNPFANFDWDSYYAHLLNSSGYNSSGYNSSGYNSSGYNSSGYTSDGYNSSGYTSDGYNSAGYNSAGYNSAGYNASGFNPIFLNFAGVTVPDQLTTLAQEYFEKLIESPVIKVGGYLTAALEVYQVVADADNMTTAEFAYKISVIGVGVASAWAALGIVSFVEFAEIIGKAGQQAESFTSKWLHDKMHPTDPDSFFSPVPQEVRDEWEAAKNTP
ncbi:hypothetical protein ACTJKC_07515 [Pedobacter sp. 22226]|uniref:hypothetical protein n=1 Tax=Pedobacter sp. 22226 TaxID=3453894 RepID=UPI003F833334